MDLGVKGLGARNTTRRTDFDASIYEKREDHGKQIEIARNSMRDVYAFPKHAVKYLLKLIIVVRLGSKV